MFWIHYLVGISHFAECGENRSVTVWEMLINPLLHNSYGSGSVTDPESVSRTRSPPKVNQFLRLVGPITIQVSMKSVNYFCSKPAQKHTEWQTNWPDHITSALAEVIIIFCPHYIQQANKKYVLSNLESVQCNIFIFDHVMFIQFKICCCVLNFIEIGWFFAEIWRYNDFQNGRPSAILELFYHHTRPPTKSLLLAADDCQIACL